MDRQDKIIHDPDQLAHLARTCRVFRQRFMISSVFFIFFSKAGSNGVIL